MPARNHRSLRRKQRGKTDSRRREKWRFGMLVVCVLSQLGTLFITWQVWQLREISPVSPMLPNLTMLPTAGIPMGWLMVLSLVVVPVKPKIGVAIHCGIYAVACLFDQFRIQPQFFTHCLLMAAVVYDAGPRMARWWLASLWLWGGLHKLLSTDWWGQISWSLVSGLPFDITSWHVVLAGVVVVSEMALGLLAIGRPKWAAIGCIGLHLGIACFLSPLGIDYNYSVIPWNLSLAIVGWWLLTESARTKPAGDSASRPIPAKHETNVWTAVAAVILLVSPVGYYVGWTHLYAAHVLYSGGTPRGMITQTDGARETIGWSELNVPFPQEREPLVQFFALTAKPGDKLHLADPRVMLSDAYFVLDENRNANPIERSQFLDPSIGNVAGREIDQLANVHALMLAGTRMLRREASGPIYAIEFSPEYFQPDQLELLSGLLNIEELQLSGTSITDADLDLLPTFPHLIGIGLDNTTISDRGLQHLRRHPNLRIIQHAGSPITAAGLKAIGIE